MGVTQGKTDRLVGMIEDRGVLRIDAVALVQEIGTDALDDAIDAVAGSSTLILGGQPVG